MIYLEVKINVDASQVGHVVYALRYYRVGPTLVPSVLDKKFEGE